MRRFAILLAPVVAATGATVGGVMSAAPAHADSLAEVHVIINQTPVDSLLSLCITSRSLHPTPACIDLGGPIP
ncbi:MAG: hypothetical protein JWP02_3201 [Acidimicrobiales bacterium]|nr:hypothetical protein [Acidimicrobiales bacterium]